VSSGGVRGASSSSAVSAAPVRVLPTRSHHIPHIAYTPCWQSVVLKTCRAVDIHISPDTTLRNNQPLAYQQTRMLARCDGIEGNISSYPANPFNFSTPSPQSFHSEAAGVTFFVGGLHHNNFSFPAPSCIFSPITLIAFSAFQRGLSTTIFKAALRKLNRLGVIRHSGRG